MVKKLPGKIANLLMNGVAIEFMDGENSYVPTTWIGGILDNLHEKTDRQ